MKRLVALLLILGSAAAAAEESAERTFTIAQSVQVALQNNQAHLSAREGVRIATQRIAEARSLIWPSLAVNLNASRYRTEDHAVLAAESGSTLLPPSFNGEADNYYSGRLALRQVLYNGGRTMANTRLAQAALAQARIREEEIRRRVTVDVTGAFYGELLARKQLALSEEAQRDLQALSASLPLSDGAARAVLEGVRARLRRAQSERRRDEERASLTFLSTLGLELYTRVSLQGDLSAAPLRPDLAKLLARAQESRLEIRGTEYQREMDRLAVNLTEAERYPVVALMAGYEVNDRAFPLDQNFWNATLNVSLPLFDGFASRARIRQTRIAANQSRIERAAIEDKIAMEVRSAHADLTYWQDEAAARRDDWDRLRELYARLPAGRDPVQKGQARLELLSAAQTYWDAVHGQLIARARLENAVGLPLDP